MASATRRDVLIYDEGIVVYAAERILKGEIPYRDFWGIYPPGQFYTLALAFKLFGTSLLVERIWEATIRLFLCLVIYRLTAKLTSPPIALTTWLLSVPVLGATGFYGYPMFTALVLSLFSALCLLNFLTQGRRASAPKPWLVLCGLSTGLTALYRLDVGFYTLAAEVIVLGAFFYTSSRNLSSTPGQGSFLHSFLLYMAATALPVGLITAYLL
ncbi:MAG: glycosyltransferase family 39 protein, partial [Acidobacteria bacterium]|nr:glycosyltransferase family 39 protein [Acidobacteriota bacterium]